MAGQTPKPTSSAGAKNTAYTMQRRLVSAKVHEFDLVSNFSKLGYRNREDITILPPGVIVAGSYNVLTNTGERIGVTKGYTLDGQANTTITPITSSFDWTKVQTNDTHMRSWGPNLEVRYVNATLSEIQWVNIFDGLNIGNTVNYCTFWNPTSLVTELLFVNGGGMLYRWSGGIASLLSATSNSITIAGTETWEQLGFDLPASYTASMTFTPASTIVGTITALSSNPVQGGTGYVVGDVLDIVGVPGSGAQCVVAAVNAGVVTAVSLTNVGSGYIVNNAAATTGGTGTGCVVNIQEVNISTSPATISDNAGGFIAAGFALGDGFTVSGTTSNNGNYQINDITAGLITLGPNFVLTTETANATLTTIQSLQIDGIRYTYTGGNGTTTFTGVFPDPTGHTQGDAITQSVDTFGNGTTTGLPSTGYSNDLIGNLDNQIFIGSLNSAAIYTSNVNNFLDYSFSQPRLQGEGNMATIAGFPTAFVNQEDSLYVSAGKDLWYRTQLVQTTDTSIVGATTSGISVAIVYETLIFQQLKVTYQQGAQSQACVTNIPNDIIYLSFEPIINTLGRVDNILLTPQITDLSYSIINDMNAYDFTDAAICYYRKFVYVSVPKEGLIRIYNMTQPKIEYWEAPVTYPIGRFSIIDDQLYGHGYSVPETYKLFDGYMFNGHEIPALLLFSFNNYGTRTQPKVFNLFYLEGYISGNCELNYGFNYDIDGCSTQRSFELDGDDRALVCISTLDASLGKAPLGKRPLGGIINQKLNTSPTGLPPKFRAIKQISEFPFYELQIFFQSQGNSQQWELLACGPNAKPASEGNNSRQY